MIKLNESEMALVAYFYTISTHPRVKAAGYDPVKFGRAVLDCVTDNLTNVTAFILGTGVRPKVAQASKRVTKTILGGTVNQKTSDAIGDEVEEKIHEGFQIVGEWLRKKYDKKR